MTGTVPRIVAFRESTISLKLPASISLTAAQTYQFTVSTSLGSDQNTANNTIVATRATAPPPANGIFSVTRCGSDTAISLRNIGTGTAFWYDSPTGGNLLAAGNQVGVKALPASGQFYATLKRFFGIDWPRRQNRIWRRYLWNGFPARAPHSTQVPLLIESARLYIGSGWHPDLHRS